MNSYLPNTLIIGVQKSATTWLSQRLGQHPDIFMAPKELHYFDNEANYRRGYSWYAKQFASSSGERILAEKTASYLWTTCAASDCEPINKAERIHAALPDAKLLAVLRDPASRAISAWNHLARSGRIPPNLSIDAIFGDRARPIVDRYGILSRGHYARQIEHYLGLFSQSQLCVFVQEIDIQLKPKKTLETACEFLGVEPQFVFQEMDVPANRFETTKLGSSLAHYTHNAFRSWIMRVDRHAISKLPLSKIQYPTPSDSTRRRLQSYFAKDIEALESLLGRSLRVWPSHPNANANH